MSLSSGPNLGLLVNGALGDQHYSELMRFLRGVDLLVQPSVLSATLATPPSTPADGDAYIVAASPTGAWTGYTNAIARWSAVLGAWEFLAPKAGWELFNNGDKYKYQYINSSWIAKKLNAITAQELGGPFSTTSTAAVKIGTLTCAITTSGNPVLVLFKVITQKTGTAANAAVMVYRNGIDIGLSFIINSSDTGFNEKTASIIDNPPPGLNNYEFYYNVESSADSISTVSSADSRFLRYISAKELFI